MGKSKLWESDHREIHSEVIEAVSHNTHNLRFGDNTFKGYYRFEVDQACSLYLHAPSESDTADTADTELNFVAPVAGKADLEGGWFEDETP